jgi:hypothetical protein
VHNPAFQAGGLIQGSVFIAVLSLIAMKKQRSIMLEKVLRSTVALLLIGSLGACAELKSSSITKNRSEFIGKNVDDAISGLTSRGLTCENKSLQRPIEPIPGLGYVSCSFKESAVFCPKSFVTDMEYELATQKVVAVYPGAPRTNCF